ncbi:MAG: sigma 54-interacting transcriptional regulator [Pirellulales bacterium]|nr:sigma 54-interacting transcriptional regulator [Pirellulales bacterium]
MTVGKRAGDSFLLDPARENPIGRGTECTVVLSDPLCSRIHAVLVHANGTWHVRDAESRNGTFVNGQKIDEAALVPGHHVRVGSTEFAFQQSAQPPTSTGDTDPGVTQTLVKDSIVGPSNTANLAIGAIQDLEQAHDLLLLYQLSIKLLGCASPDEVVRISLDLLRDRTSASLAAFLWVSDDGRLTPKMFLPEQPLRDLPLSESLTHLVLAEGHAIWIASQRGGGTTDETLRHYADALCVPLLNGTKVVGAIHAYLEHGRFRQSQFDFAISLANISAVALVRARHDVSVQTDLQRLKEKSAGFGELIGESPPMLELKSKIGRLGRATGCVLVRGESGAGKELVARALHRASTRADRPMLSVNCAAIPADLMESQLFGHKAGSFTGADRDHVGYFQQADLGTLFLDEVGEMTLQGQAKLLRILEGHPFLPVGGNEEIRVDVRIIAATNQDLQAYVRERKFREDLYYRLSVFELFVPPLRERGSDVSRLIDFFLEHFRQQHGRPRLELAEEAKRRLLGYNWPGNVRQLRNVIDSAVVLAAGDRIEADDLGLRDPHGGGGFDTLRIDDWERRLIREALDRSDGNVPEAAKLLGIGRATLYRKIEEYGIDRK